MKTVFVILINLVLAFGNLKAQSLQWISFDELDSKMHAEEKPVMVFIYTDWCKYCFIQEATTFMSPKVIDRLNKEYYLIKLNAEASEDIEFFGKVYHFTSNGNGTGYHELAEFLGQYAGILSFPT